MGPHTKRQRTSPHKIEYIDPHIPTCNVATVFQLEHYYDCKPYQHDVYTFEHWPTGIRWTAEAMHALQPMWRNLPEEYRRDPRYLWHMEETTHALLHGQLERARQLAASLRVSIIPHH